MHKVLVVDDEPEILAWLVDLLETQTTVEWEIHSARSARQALEILDTIFIELVLTDVRMPGLNGIELFHKIRERAPLCHVIFLTGHRDFDYLYAAVQSGGVRYLLKTEGDQAIMAAVLAAVADIEEQRTQGLKCPILTDRSLSLVREKLLQEIGAGLSTEADLTQTRFDQLGIPLMVASPVMMIIGRIEMVEKHGISRFTEILRLQELIKSALPGKDRLVVWGEGGRIYCLIQVMSLQLGDSSFARRFGLSIRSALEQIQEQLDRKSLSRITFALSSKPFLIQDLPLYQHALLTRLGNFTGPYQVIVMTEVDPFPEKADEFPSFYQSSAKVRLLEDFLVSRQSAPYFSLLDQLCAAFRCVKEEDWGRATELYYSLALVLLRVANAGDSRAWKTETMTFARLFHPEVIGSWQLAAATLRDVSQGLFVRLGAENTSRSTQTVRAVKTYIDEHLPENLTLSQLAEHVRLNPSYLSRIFSQIVGTGLTEYVIGVRMNKAKELLQMTDLQVQRVAQEVGYLSLHSFDRVFKAHTGQTPQEYRCLASRR